MKLTVKQTADYLGVSRQRADQLISKWDFAIIRTKIGNRTVKTVNQDDIDHWLQYRTEDRFMPRPPKGWVTTDEAAKRLNLSRESIRRHCRNGLLSHIRTENRLFVSEQSLHNFVPPKRGRPSNHNRHQENHHV